MWANYHTHSTYCDGKMSIVDTARIAMEKNMIALGFSTHAPLPFHRGWCMKKERLPDYIEELKVLKSGTGFEIYAGLEVDYIPGKIAPTDFSDDLDYTIGSVHFVETFDDGDGWEIDNTLQVFNDGLTRIFRNDIRAAISRYYELTREMVERGTPTIVGHMDKIKMHNKDNLFFSEQDGWYRAELIKTLDVIADAGCIVEVNTRGIYKKRTSEPYPSRWIIEEMRERNIPMTISSDAHHPDDLIDQFPETARMMAECGVRTISTLIEGKWQAMKFDEHGIRRH